MCCWLGCDIARYGDDCASYCLASAGDPLQTEDSPVNSLSKVKQMIVVNVKASYNVSNIFRSVSVLLHCFI